MAEISGRGSARATIGPAHAASEVELHVTTVLVGLGVVLAALVIVWTAERAAPSRKIWQLPFTELESAAQDFEAHLATTAELGTAPVSVPVAYPARTAPGVTSTMHQGFSQQWRPTQPLPTPAREAW